MLTVQFGQCGNQIGSKLYSKITEDIKATRSNESSSNQKYIEDATAKWFQGLSKSGCMYARAVLVDTEKKVINKIIKQKEDKWCYRASNIVSTDYSSGSANNWAYGFVKKGPEFEEFVHDAVRYELELSDTVDTFLCLSGCAGGTGSGLGSFVIQSLRDEYPKKSILSTLLLPFGSGEIATQNYNILLSLAKIIDSADMLVVMANDKLHDEVTKFSNFKSQGISFPNDINEVACQKLLSVLQLANDVDSNSLNDVGYMVSKLVPHPAYKFTGIETIPLVLPNSNNLLDKSWTVQKDSINWQTQYKYLRRNLLSANINEGNKSRSLANILITRGFKSDKVKKNNKLVYHQHDDLYNCDELVKNDIYAQLHWLTDYDKLRHLHQNRRLLNYDKFSSLITNNSSINKTLDVIVGKAWNSYTYGAFLHQYKKFEMEDDDFLSAFSKIEGVISSYKELERHS